MHRFGFARRSTSRACVTIEVIVLRLGRLAILAGVVMYIGAAAEGVGEAFRAMIFFSSFAILLLSTVAVSVGLMLRGDSTRTSGFVGLALLVVSQVVLLLFGAWYWAFSAPALFWRGAMLVLAAYSFVTSLQLLRHRSSQS